MQTDQMTDALYKRLGEIETALAANEDWFRNLWEGDADRWGFYMLALALRPDLTQAQWDDAWDHRLVLHEDYGQAKIEFCNAVVGWY